MMLLPDEMMRQNAKTLTLIFGDPVPWTTLDRSHTDAEWAQIIKEKVYQLSELIT
jgi:hypothetical protein